MEEQKEKKHNQPVIPPRLQVLLSETSQAVVLCRKKAQQVGTFGWDRNTDKITPGQWLKGRIYFENCDLSPDGNYFIYHAMGKGSWKTWTAVSKVPYLKALDFYMSSCSFGGGLFLSNNSYWLDAPSDRDLEHKHSLLKVVKECPYKEKIENYHFRLKRNGWSEVDEELAKDIQLGYKILQKEMGLNWVLYSDSCWVNNPPPGTLRRHEKYHLINTQNGNECDCSDWEWADLDGKRIVWTAQGKLFAAKLNNQGLTQLKVLHDFNNEEFVAVAAPY